MSDYRKTKLYDSHQSLKAKLVPFSGFWMPLQYRLTLVLQCPMDLHDYPLDNQACPMELESCEYKIICRLSQICFH